MDHEVAIHDAESSFLRHELGRCTARQRRRPAIRRHRGLKRLALDGVLVGGEEHPTILDHGGAIHRLQAAEFDQAAAIPIGATDAESTTPHTHGQPTFADAHAGLHRCVEGNAAIRDDLKHDFDIGL
jgi:hypothetical protein